MPELIAFPQLIKNKRTQRHIRNMQNIGMTESQTPAENMSKSHFGVYPVYRMFYTEERENTK